MQGRRSFISLFSGCGGFDVGFVRAGFTPVAGFESDPNVARQYRRTVSAPVYVTDLAETFPAPSSCRNISAMIAGPPCQGFSVAGLRNLVDSRNKLFPPTA